MFVIALTMAKFGFDTIDTKYFRARRISNCPKKKRVRIVHFKGQISSGIKKIKNRTTGLESRLAMADRAVSRLGLNRYPWCSYTGFGQRLGVEHIGVVVH